jgi:short-subunit dehydrogenase
MNILVTGASSGIGAALARLLAARGDTVGIVGRRAEKLQAVLDDCRRTAPASAMWVADLADIEGAEKLALEAWDQFGGLDAIVHNAAEPMRRRVQQITFDEVEHTMRVNFFSPTRMTLAVLPRMLERDAGVIVNVSSLGGRLGIIHETAYCASKFALCGWSEAMAIDLAKTNVRVVLINPGAVDTDIWDRPGSDAPVYDGPKVPPEEVAPGIVAAIDATNTQSQAFEHYIPDMKAVVEWKTSNIDEFLSSVALMDTT